MPIVKTVITPLTLCVVLTTPCTFASPVTDLPPAPSAISIDEPSMSPAATADTPLPTMFISSDAGRTLNLGKLESIQAETVLYEAQLARTKALNELHKNGYDGPLNQPFNPLLPSQDNKTVIKGTAQEVIPPQIIEITGTGKGFTAVLSLINGNLVTVQTGNRIPGTEYVVKKINLNEVIVSGKNQSLVSLSFAG